MFFSVITTNLSWEIVTKWGQGKKEEGGDFEREGGDTTRYTMMKKGLIKKNALFMISKQNTNNI